MSALGIEYGLQPTHQIQRQVLGITGHNPSNAALPRIGAGVPAARLASDRCGRRSCCGGGVGATSALAVAPVAIGVPIYFAIKSLKGPLDSHFFLRLLYSHACAVSLGGAPRNPIRVPRSCARVVSHFAQDEREDARLLWNPPSVPVNL